MSDSTFRELDDSEITALFSGGHNSADRENVRDSWVDYAQLQFVRKFRIQKFEMKGRPFIAFHENDMMFIRAAWQYAPCGWFSDETIEKYV